MDFEEFQNYEESNYAEHEDMFPKSLGTIWSGRYTSKTKILISFTTIQQRRSVILRIEYSDDDCVSFEIIKRPFHLVVLSAKS